MPELPGKTLGPDTQALLAAIGKAGFQVEPDSAPPATIGRLRAPKAAYKVGGESLVVWEYPNPGAAADDSKRVSARGIDGGFDHLGTEAKWFLKGRLVVLYIGVHPGLRAWLVGVLGAAFVDGHAT